MNRPLWHYAAAMKTWLSVLGLSDFEKSVIERLHTAAEKDEQSFWDAVEETRLYLAAPLATAMEKGLADSRLRSWLHLFNHLEETASAAA